MITRILAAALVALLTATGLLTLQLQQATQSVERLTTTNAELRAEAKAAREAAQVQQAAATRKLETLKNDLRKKNNRLESERATAATVTDSLLKHLADVKARIPTHDAPAARAAADRAGTALGQCAAQYRDLAATADRLAIKSNTLIGVAEICGR